MATLNSVFQNSWNFTIYITLEYTVQTGKRSHKINKIFTVDLTIILLHSVKSMVKISSIFVAFLENMNFTLNSVFQNSWNFTTYITLEYTVQTGKRSHKAIKWRLFLYSFFSIVLHTIVELQHMFYKPTVWIIHFLFSVLNYCNLPKVFWYAAW